MVVIASPKNITNKDAETHNNPLLTQKALELSLSPPRAPPFGTAQRAIYAGNAPNPHHSWAHTYIVPRCPSSSHAWSEPHAIFREKLQALAASKTKAHTRSKQHHHLHPHMPKTSADRVTRTIGTHWTVARQNRFRDDGYFRAVADAAVVWTAPVLALTAPSAVGQFLKLTRTYETVSYGPHALQYMHVFVPPSSVSSAVSSSPTTARVVFFVHGGAWGSGAPWMYRLVAKPFLDRGYAVVIPSYRTYPDGTVLDQVEDLEWAAVAVQEQQSRLVSWRNNKNTAVTLMGHSSGAHIAMLLLMHRVKQQRLSNTSTTSSFFNTTNRDASHSTSSPLPPVSQRLQFDSFIGLSGPYDISHHFDYEAGRGVEEVSPMKACCGHSQVAFRQHSPAHVLRTALATVDGDEYDGTESWLPPHLALFHGIEDDTVPFTATAEAAHGLRACGVRNVEEVYVDGTGHQDMILQIMLGGKTLTLVTAWIERLSSSDSSSDGTNSSKRVILSSKL